MTRKEFIQMSALLGIGLPFTYREIVGAKVATIGEVSRLIAPFPEKVIIIGAGAAGLYAGFLLKKRGVDFEIVEAAPVYGGRLKKIDDFADFPIDLGAEWIHTPPVILNELSHRSVLPVETIDYNPQSIACWNKERLRKRNFMRFFYSEWKFKSSTWFDFFEQYIIPEIADHIHLNQPVAEVHYAGKEVQVKTANTSFNADKLLITSSVKTLQSKQLHFNPPLPSDFEAALASIFMGDGIKVFVEFKKRFYPDIIVFGNMIQASLAEEKFVYDAAFGKNSTRNILGLFAINGKAKEYTALKSDQEIISKFLVELDEIFAGQASANYLKHVIQNWSNEPYIRGAYSYSFEGKQKGIVHALQKPIQDKVYFAGEALSIENQSTVHGACESARTAIEAMLAQG